MANKLNLFSLSNIKMILSFLKQDKLIIFFALFLSLINAALTIVSSIFLGETLNLISDQKINATTMLHIFYASLIILPMYLIAMGIHLKVMA